MAHDTDISCLQLPGTILHLSSVQHHAQPLKLPYRGHGIWKVNLCGRCERYSGQGIGQSFSFILFPLAVPAFEALETGLCDVIRIRLKGGIIQPLLRSFLSHFSFHPSYLDAFLWRHTGHFPAIPVFCTRPKNINPAPLISI